MAKAIGLVELLFKGMLASYLLLFAFEIHKHPQKFATVMSHNLRSYVEAAGYEWGFNIIESQLLYYCQFLVLISLAIVCGMRFGDKLGWLVVLLNLVLTWNKT
jgi:hypothetical protein